jgi:hypothetical protein
VNTNVQYRYAVDEARKSIDVLLLKDHEATAGKVFYCVGCGERMVAKLGNKLTHHFAHYNANAVCATETYLHKLAKLVFREEYQKCLVGGQPFWIEWEQRTVCGKYPGSSERVCQTRPKLVRCNYVKEFRSLKVETKASEFLPDVTLISQRTQERVFVEFAVTHACSAAKLASRNPIIEIKLTGESSLDPVRAHLLSSSDQRVVFHNFPKERKDPNMCAWFSYCELEKEVFALYKDGSWRITQLRPHEELPSSMAENIAWETSSFINRRLDSMHFEGLPMEYARAAYDDGFRVKDCRFCEHFTRRRFGRKECSKLEEQPDYRFAARCEFYQGIGSEELVTIFIEDESY